MDARSQHDETEPGVIRTASCTCSHVAVDVRGEPAFAAVGACRNCRTRTGSAFGVNA